MLSLESLSFTRYPLIYCEKTTPAQYFSYFNVYMSNVILLEIHLHFQYQSRMYPFKTLIFE